VWLPWRRRRGTVRAPWLASMPDWLHAPDYSVARMVLSRGLGAIYLVAFTVALEQFPALLGDRGLLPVSRFVSRVPFRRAPSLFWFRYSDTLLRVVALVGIVVSLAVVVGLPDRLPAGLTMAAWLLLWVLYLSIVNVGQRFYAFGWESLLLEAGFLAIFLGPSSAAVPLPILWLFRWLVVRVELGAGLIKLRGDPCWRNLTCLYYHHETQPMPNPLSWYFHHLPKALHRVEVAGSHVAQLVAPVLLFLPQPIASVGAAVMIVTQAWLVLSGNFSWLNALTIVLSFSAFDDAALAHVVSPSSTKGVPLLWHDALTMAVTLAILVLSYRPAKNLFSRRQVMNASFDPLHLVNTYGAFGHVTRERFEVVLEGTSEDRIGAGTVWLEYEFRGKPTDPKRRPRQWAPYHLRLDWLMWFAALSSFHDEPWFLPMVMKLLQSDAAILRLLAKNPFPDGPPRAIRATLYRYRFTSWKERRATGAYWTRTRIGQYLPPVRLDDHAPKARRSALLAAW
jgi:hypothetical protein